MALGIVAKGLLGAGKVVGKGVGLAGRGAMMAGRAGMALRGRKKKINTSKLMGREGGEQKGGALAAAAAATAAEAAAFVAAAGQQQVPRDMDVETVNGHVFL